MEVWGASDNGDPNFESSLHLYGRLIHVQYNQEKKVDLIPVNYVIFTKLYGEQKGVGLRGVGVGWCDLFDWGFS